MISSKNIVFALFLLSAGSVKAQFHPPAGVPGTSAMHADSSSFVAWANTCSVERGWVHYGIDSLGLMDTGLDEYGTGKALSNPTVSLGDGGIATLSFINPITNGEGYDFAVFENSFDGLFLELAFVEVSSDGENFVRFPATTLADTSVAVGSFDLMDARNFNNLAGKYQMGFGTPFDLEELTDSSAIDIESITHVRIIDVIGTAQWDVCSRDYADNPILDPFPTPFLGGGFDLDAVGVIHDIGTTNIENRRSSALKLYPQPANNLVFVEGDFGSESEVYLRVFSLSGALVLERAEFAKGQSKLSLEVSNLDKGVYFIEILGERIRFSSPLYIFD